MAVHSEPRAQPGLRDRHGLRVCRRWDHGAALGLIGHRRRHNVRRGPARRVHNHRIAGWKLLRVQPGRRSSHRSRWEYPARGPRRGQPAVPGPAHPRGQLHRFLESPGLQGQSKRAVRGGHCRLSCHHRSATPVCCLHGTSALEVRDSLSHSPELSARPTRSAVRNGDCLLHRRSVLLRVLPGQQQ